jgi:hypothetical protein
LRASRALGPLAVAAAGGLVAVAGALVLVTVRPRRHAVALSAADPAVLEAVVVPARLGAPERTLAVAELCQEEAQEAANEVNTTPNRSKGKRRAESNTSEIEFSFSMCEVVFNLIRPWRPGGPRSPGEGRRGEPWWWREASFCLRCWY